MPTMDNTVNAAIGMIMGGPDCERGDTAGLHGYEAEIVLLGKLYSLRYHCDVTPPDRRTGPPRVAFLLAQLGAWAADQFAARLTTLDLTPAQAGLLRQIAHHPERTQQEHARTLGMRPTRFVAFLDELEHRGLIARRRGAQDRRSHTLHLTSDGETALRQLRDIAEAHEEALCEGLSPADRTTLAGLLHQMADRQGLVAGIHPRYRR